MKSRGFGSVSRIVNPLTVLDLENIAIYNKRATGEKFLINPNKG